MKLAKITLVVGIAALCTLPAMAGHHRGGHHHRDHNDGVRLAADIIGLVKNALTIPVAVVTPAPVVVEQPVVQPSFYHCPPPPPRPCYRPAPPPRHHEPRHHAPRHHRGPHRR